MPPGVAGWATLALAVVACIGWWWWVAVRTHRTEASSAGSSSHRSRATADQNLTPPFAPTPAAKASTNRSPIGPLSPEKTARVAAILSDYEAMRAKASAEHENLGERYPGGLKAFLRQLVLLEREKRLDLAAVLTPAELEDYELQESPAGHTVQELLEHSGANDEQRRAVFRLQREFDDRFALSFDSSPSAALERERVRVDLQEKIHGALGSNVFAAWLRGEGAEYGQFSTFAAQHSLPATTALDLWRMKNDYTLRRLELSARTDLPANEATAAHRALLETTTARVRALLGANAFAKAYPELLGWLPKP